MRGSGTCSSSWRRKYAWRAAFEHVEPSDLRGSGTCSSSWRRKYALRASFEHVEPSDLRGSGTCCRRARGFTGRPCVTFTCTVVTRGCTLGRAVAPIGWWRSCCGSSGCAQMSPTSDCDGAPNTDDISSGSSNVRLDAGQMRSTACSLSSHSSSIESTRDSDTRSSSWLVPKPSSNAPAATSI